MDDKITYELNAVPKLKFNTDKFEIGKKYNIYNKIECYEGYSLMRKGKGFLDFGKIDTNNGVVTEFFPITVNIAVEKEYEFELINL